MARVLGPLAASTMPPPPFDPSNAARGAKNVVTRCLCAVEGETVHVITYHADAIFELISKSLHDAGAKVRRVVVDDMEAEGLGVNDYAIRIAASLGGATATVFLAPGRPSGALSFAVAKAAETLKTRHVHLLEVDERLLGQAVRADPELLAIVNERLSAALRPPCLVKVTSDAGTDLEVRLALMHPILSSSGRPSQGTSENLPAGVVYTHPARVSGTLVVDRAIFGPGLSPDRGTLRKNAVKFTFAGGRVSGFESPDPAIAQLVEKYIASHADAGRVGLVVWPTNYLARSEIGIDRQDMLLPGMNLSLGYASSEVTKAPYEAPVQMILLGRKQTVEVDGRKIVEGGRFDQAMVEGIDPFR